MNLVKWRDIGIIGGLGPRASAHFHKLLIDLCSADHAVQDYDYPFLVHVNLASRALSEVGIEDENALIEDLSKAFAILVSAGVAVVCIACNSVHASITRFPQYHELQLVNLAEVIAEVAHSLQARNVVILCGETLRNSRAYDIYFVTKGIEPHYPEMSTQALVDQWIIDVMAGRHSYETATNLLTLLNELSLRFSVVIVACSELSVLLDLAVLPANIIDSMHVLAETTLRLSRLG